MELTVPELLQKANYAPCGDYERDRINSSFPQIMSIHAMNSLIPFYETAFSQDLSLLQGVKSSDKILDLLIERYKFKILRIDYGDGTEASHSLYNDYAMAVFSTYTSSREIHLKVFSLDNA